jgi:exopolysaccharide biosynthesis polyprenyl glycosylphosphotransferase
MSDAAPWPEALDRPAGQEVVRRLGARSNLPVVGRSGVLVAIDVLALVLGAVVASLFTSARPLAGALDPQALQLCAATLPAWLVGAHLSGLYRRDGLPAVHPTAAERWDVGQLVLVAAAALVLVAIASRIAPPAGGELAVFGAAAVSFAVTGRLALRALSQRPDGSSATAVIVGAGDVGQLVARKLLRHPEYGLKLVGFVDAPPRRWRRDVAKVPLLGAVGDLASIVRDLGVDRVIVAFSRESDEDTLALVRPLLGLDVRVDVVPRMFEMMGPKAGLLDVEGMPLVSVSPRARSAIALRAKRLIDVAGATLGLILGAPLFLWAWWRIPRESPGPVFHRQVRLGADMREFTMLKFRTLAVDADQSAHEAYIERAMSGTHVPALGELYKLDRSDVVTRTGRWLRRTSLDELPQLINVLQGKMSLVGPRPCLAYETAHFARHHYERFLTPPGITGLWQVTARAHASFAEALEMDVAYVRDWSLALDLRLIVRTPVEVLRQRKATV